MINDATRINDTEDTTCIGCTAVPGQLHDGYCDHAHCPACGGQRAMCETEGIHEDAGPSVWTGECRYETAAREFDLYRPFVLHPRRDPITVADDWRVRTELAWDRTAQRFVAHTPTDVSSDGSMCVWVTAGGS